MIIRLEDNIFNFAEYQDKDIDLENTIHFKTRYFSPILNLANTYAKGTSQKTMGFSLNEYMAEYNNLIKEENQNLESWKSFVKKKNQNIDKEIENSVDKIYSIIQNFQKVILQIDKKIIEDWVCDLLYLKTFNGFHLQNTIIKAVALKLGHKYKFGTKEEESKGIDGYIGDIPVNVKPYSHKGKVLQEKLNVKMIYYKELSDGSYDVEFDINPKIIIYKGKPIILKYFKGDITSIEEINRLYKDGYNAIEGNILLSKKIDLITIKNKIPLYVTGNYEISGCGLNSLIGLTPVSVLGNTDVSDNLLKTLEGIGEYTGGDFNISKNPLLSCDFSLEIIGGNLIAKDILYIKELKFETLIRGKIITE